MKKIILLATLLLAAVSANAQYKPGTFSVEIKAAFGASMLTKMPSFPENPPTEIMDRKMIVPITRRKSSDQGSVCCVWEQIKDLQLLTTLLCRTVTVEIFCS